MPGIKFNHPALAAKLMSKKQPLHISGEDEVLFHLIKKKDNAAFTVIYYKYHKYLYALAMRYLKDAEMAEETVQYVFVKFWETTGDIDIQVNLKNYLFTMTKNYILNTIRNKKNLISLNYEKSQIEIEDDAADFLKMIEDSQLISMLHKGIENLPPQKKEICLKKITGNKSNQEIADEMGISVHTVKSHYQESIRMLRTYFGDQEKNISLFLITALIFLLL